MERGHPQPPVIPFKLRLPADPKPGQIFVSPLDGTELVFISGGAFKMGGTGEHDGKPVHEQQVEGFWLGRSEVTNAQYGKFLEATDHRVPRYWDDDKYNQPDQPVVSVTWHDAIAYCNWAGVRLPTEAEWEYAARGGKQYEYGTSTGELSHDLANYEGSGGKDTWNDRTAPVGSFPANPFSLYDMCGNVLEWCSSLYKPYPYKADDGREDVAAEGWRVLRGGAFDSTLLARCVYRDRSDPDNRDPHVGFRLCASL